ncbi:MAG: hypothetical protein ACP5N3_04320 [Candidatus Nanoarchaeia archaeon]
MKKAIFALILLTALLVAACTDSGTGNTGTSGFVGGTKGLDIIFYSGAPPASTPDMGQQEFDVIVEITNGGEDDVEVDEAIVKLSGFPPEPFNVGIGDLTKNPEEKIEKVIKTADGSIINPPTIPVTFPGFNYLDEEVASRTFPIRAEICYKYTTKAAAELCIKENFNSIKSDDLCKVTEERALSTSGAPVQITSLRQSTAGADKTRFTFTIQNMDEGKIYKTDSACEQTTANENKVFVQIGGLGDNDVRCVGLTGGTTDAGYVTLIPGQAKDVSCTVTFLNRNNRIQPFTIDMTYSYWKYLDTSILIEHTPE